MALVPTEHDAGAGSPAAPTVVLGVDGRLHWATTAAEPAAAPEVNADPRFTPIPRFTRILMFRPIPRFGPIVMLRPMSGFRTDAELWAVPIPRRRSMSLRRRSAGRRPALSRRRRLTECHRLRTHYGGWRRSPPDPRRRVADTFGIRLRTKVDPRNEMPPVFDQGRLGACTANATAAAFEYDAMLDGNFTGRLARLWIYYQERRLEGVLDEGDTGARGSDAFVVARQIGIPAETDWPYEIADFQGPPPERALRDAAFYRLTRPYATPPLNRHAFKQIFSNQQTVSFGFAVSESFDSAAVARSGIVPMPATDEEIIGGHEMLAVGYLKGEQEYVLVRNSWGSRQTGGRGWGLDGSGYCLMPWRMILDPQISGDWMTIVRPIARR